LDPRLFTAIACSQEDFGSVTAFEVVVGALVVEALAGSDAARGSAPLVSNVGVSVVDTAALSRARRSAW